MGDLTQVNWATVPHVDLVTAGFPCQDISTAGRGAGIKEGTRGGLWTHIAQVLGQLRPAYVLVENVAALRNRGLGRVLADLAALGYNTQWASLRAGDIGAAHRRDRIFILYLDNFCCWMPDSGRFRATGLLGSRWILGRVAGVLARSGEQALGGGLQLGGGVVGERLAVAEAGNLGVEGGQPPERRGRLCAADVEYAAHDLPGWAARYGVAGEQHLVPGKVERDAARRMAGHGHRYGPVAEAERVAVVQLPVNPGRHHGFGRELAHDLLVNGLFPVGQVRRRPRPPGHG